MVEINSDITPEKIAAASALPKTAGYQGWFLLLAGSFFGLALALKRSRANLK